MLFDVDDWNVAEKPDWKGQLKLGTPPVAAPA